MTMGQLDEKKILAAPRALMCHVCGRLYGLHSFGIHIKQCKKLWIAREALKDKCDRKKVPQDPEIMQKYDYSQLIDVSDAELAEINRVTSEIYNTISLSTCLHCGRSFLLERLIVHNRSCTFDNPCRQPLTSSGSPNRASPKQYDSPTRPSPKQYDSSTRPSPKQSDSPNGRIQSPIKPLQPKGLAKKSQPTDSSGKDLKWSPNNSPNNGPYNSPNNGPYNSPNNGPHNSPNNGPNFSPNNNPNYSPNDSQNVNPNINNSPNKRQNINPNNSPNLNPNISPKISPNMNPNINPKISPNINPNISPSKRNLATGYKIDGRAMKPSKTEILPKSVGVQDIQIEEKCVIDQDRMHMMEEQVATLQDTVTEMRTLITDLKKHRMSILRKEQTQNPRPKKAARCHIS
jgi:zinc-finger of a C2HC-type